MSEHTLEEIVTVEKEIQAHLAEERGRAAAWVAAECAAISQAVEARVAAAQQESHQQITAAEAEAGTTVTDLLRRAEGYVTRLQGLSEEELRQLVRHHLARLLPEKPA